MVEELGPGRRQFGDFDLEACRTVHTATSLAFRLESGGRSLLYTGDTDVSPEVTALAAGVDLLLVECSAPDDAKLPGHLTPQEIATMALEARPGRIVLTHLFPAADGPDITALIAERTGIEVIKAEDLMVFEV